MKDKPQNKSMKQKLSYNNYLIANDTKPPPIEAVIVVIADLKIFVIKLNILLKKENTRTHIY